MVNANKWVTVLCPLRCDGRCPNTSGPNHNITDSVSSQKDIKINQE